MLNNLELLQKYYKGANQKSITEEELFKIKIPVCSLERQREMVSDMDDLYRKNEQMKREIDANLEYAKSYMCKI